MGCGCGCGCSSESTDKKPDEKKTVDPKVEEAEELKKAEVEAVEASTVEGE